MIHHASNIPSEKQTDDLTIPVVLIGSFLSQVDSIFQSGFPEGKFEYYVETDMRQRVSKTEERLANTDLHEIEMSLRKAGEVHKEVRSYVQSKIRPGMRYWDICCDLEDKVRLLIGENGPSVPISSSVSNLGGNGLSHRHLSESHRGALHAESRRFHGSPIP